MLVVFKYPRKLQIPGKGAKLYQAAAKPQDVPDVMANDWFFKAMIKSGDLAIVPAAIAESKAEKPEKADAPAPQKKS